MPTSRKRTTGTFQKFRDEMVAELHNGSAGVARWNRMTRAQRKSLGRLRRLDLTGLKLRTAKLGELDLQETNFTGADLREAHFGGADVKGAVFDNAKASGAWFAGINAADASFRDADLRNCIFRMARLSGADFTGAKLGRADLSSADVCGANFAGAKLNQASFDRGKFDEDTVFPDGFEIPEGLIWAGKGEDPRNVAPPPEPIDFDTLLQRLSEDFYAPRLKKSMQMLKAESFQLFAEVEENSVTGVIKSQTDPDLVYACRLDAEGRFACCTQKLYACGGLRWALCKHLLLLIVGLTKEGKLDPTTVSSWIEASKMHRPKHNRKLMSEVFLKYKGAEAGEIDWRPTETVPEDYYAF